MSSRSGGKRENRMLFENSTLRVDLVEEGVGREDAAGRLGSCCRDPQGMVEQEGTCRIWRQVWDGTHQTEVLVLNLKGEGEEEATEGQVGNGGGEGRLGPHLAFPTSDSGTCRAALWLFFF